VRDAEKTRQLRVQILFLEDENDELQSQLARNDERIDRLEKSNEDIQQDSEVSSSNLESAQSDLRFAYREIETLKVGLDITRAQMKRRY